MVINQEICERVIRQLLDDFSAETLIKCEDDEERTANEILFCLFNEVVLGRVDLWPWLADIAKRADNAEAMLLIGVLYLHGIGVEKNTVEALSWFNAASQAGSVDAMIYQGVMYWYGVGTLKNKTLAIKWVKLAAEENYAPAQKILAQMQVLRSEVKV